MFARLPDFMLPAATPPPSATNLPVVTFAAPWDFARRTRSLTGMSAGRCEIQRTEDRLNGSLRPPLR
ncbi:hypothetical protein Scani_38980 [Streptomyces caniferus]|uniref:Uncharacterized protein n=1 Tax=Streptomyces caniferus TaxID=285557 RepID=A0A640S8V5_9ACTN|nr:hypothetical protein Scani_38980 [Streptomyces caniferus]